MIATIIVACITAISAIIAPIITAIVNNRYQLKMKCLELYEEKRISTINQYISYISCYLNRVSTSSLIEMGTILNSIYLYTPKKLWKDISKLNECIEKGQLNQARLILPEISQKLSPSVFNSKY